MTIDEMKQLALDTLDDIKAVDVSVIDVKDKTSITDWVIIATGSSSRHVRSIANSVAVAAKAADHAPLGTEGEIDGDWVLVDLGDVIVHVMQQQAREYYDLDSLWSLETLNRQQQSGE